MNRYLLFQLYGPWCAWGEVAVGEVRPSETRPTRSALLGLLAAALGIRREEQARLDALAAALRFAVVVDAPGVPEVDYHTVQTSAPRRGRVFRSRPDQLALPRHELETILSQRHYRADALYRVAVSRTEGGAAPSLDELATALRRPAFPLFLGRKSCPLAVPLAPRVVEAPDALAAFATAAEASPAQAGEPAPEPLPARELRRLARRHEPWLYWEEGFPSPGLDRHFASQRRDEPGRRSAWLFHTRRELAAPFPAPAFSAPALAAPGGAP